jgi:hypothetical protein
LSTIAVARLVTALVALTGLALALVGTLGLGEAGAASSGGIGDSSSTSSTSTSAEPTKYKRLWERVPRRDRRWARSTAKCESGGDPAAIGGGGRYRGAFQFLRSTWKRAPKSPGGDPVRYSYRTQAVVAVGLKRREGAGHWPVCG